MVKCANPKCDNDSVFGLKGYYLCPFCNWEWHAGAEEFARPAKKTVCASCGEMFNKARYKSICPICNHVDVEGETMTSLKEKRDRGEGEVFRPSRKR